MDEETFRATFVLMDTYTNFGTSKEDVQKETKSKIREAYGFIDNEIIRILPYEEAVQKPLSLEDVLKVEEPLREWPSPAAIAAHKKNGGRWLCELESIFGNPPAVKIGQFYENTVFADYRLEDYCYETGRELWRLCLKFGPVDENYNRMPWPTDGEGNPL